MTNFKFIIVKIKSLILPFAICLFTISLLIFSNSNLEAAKRGIAMWYNSVLPSLLPFFIATELISYTNIVTILGRILNPIMRPLFNVPGEGALALILGTISGYPVGAKVVVNLKENGICTDEEAERLISFTNNSGPLFILGIVGISIFANLKLGVVLLIIHIISALTVGFIFRFWKYSSNKTTHKKIFNITKEYVHFCNLGEVLSKSIFSGIKSVVMIGGFIVFFSVILSILANSRILSLIAFIINSILLTINIDSSIIIAFINGLLELTNGLFALGSISAISTNAKIYLISFLLGFGGLSILLQVFSTISKSKISIKPYFIGKILQGIFSVIYMFLWLKFV